MAARHTSQGERGYEALFEGAPVAIWEEDFSDVWQYLDDVFAGRSADRGAHLEQHPEVVLGAIRRVRILRVNRLAKEFYGAKTTEELREEFVHLFDKESVAIFREELIAFLGGQTRFDRELHALTLGGERRLVQMNVSILPVQGPPWSRVVVAFTDISERHRAEEELRESERKLQESSQSLRRMNADLEQFAWAAAHDLREPLRTISLYAQFLSRLKVDSLGAPAAAALHFILDGSTRMERLVRDLLLFARAMEYSEPDPSLYTQSGDALAEALKNLDAAISEAQATIDISPLPAVCADYGQLRQVFQNLISNAIKYRHPSRALRIAVGCERHGSESLFCVADNGCGIRPEYHERIFRVFQRLHGHEIKGSGIGLALCRQLIEHNRGRIWVESDLDAGARFFFTVPSA